MFPIVKKFLVLQTFSLCFFATFDIKHYDNNFNQLLLFYNCCRFQILTFLAFFNSLKTLTFKVRN